MKYLFIYLLMAIPVCWGAVPKKYQKQSDSTYQTTHTQGRIALPNVFFPQRTDTPNNKFVAKGEGVANITLRIFNRTGQIVYSSSDWDEIQTTGWNGKVGDVLQNSEMYVWYISGSFIDGTPLKTIDGKQTGTVLLMR